MITLEEKISRNKSVVETNIFPVTKQHNADGTWTIQDNRGRNISKVSERYTVVQNRDLIMPFINKFGYENVKQMYQYGAQKYLVCKINTGRQFEIAPGDFIDEQVVIQNSYNKTRSFSFIVGAFRSVCSNGLYYGSANLAIRRIHVGSIPTEELVSSAISSLETNNFHVWKNLQNVPLTQEQQHEAINRFNCFTEDDKFGGNKWTNTKIRLYSNNIVRKPSSIDNQRNAWGLYNQINRGISQTINAPSAVSRRINANKSAEEYLTKMFLN
jgi:hypothetical protein